MWSFSRCWFGYQKLTHHPHHHLAFSNGCFVCLLDSVLFAILLHCDWIIILRNVFCPEKSKNTSRGGHWTFFLNCPTCHLLVLLLIRLYSVFSLKHPSVLFLTMSNIFIHTFPSHCFLFVFSTGVLCILFMFFSWQILVQFKMVYISESLGKCLCIPLHPQQILQTASAAVPLLVWLTVPMQQFSVGLTEQFQCWSDWTVLLLVWLDSSTVGLTGQLHCWSGGLGIKHQLTYLLHCWSHWLSLSLCSSTVGLTEQFHCWSD